MMSILSPLLFAVLALAYLMLSRQGDVPVAYFWKILPLLLLFVSVSWSWRGLPNPNAVASRRFWWFGLTFGMVGDVLLAIDGQRLFVFGLAAFLIGHLGYLLALRPLARFESKWLLPYIGYAAVVIALMWPQLGAMALPVMLYIGVILAMSLATWATLHSNRALQLGGLLFIASDSMIGLNKFWQPIPYASELIMLTYYAAQWLIAYGMYKRAQAL